MSLIPSLFAISRPAMQAATEPLAGDQGDVSSAFAAFLGLFGPDVDPLGKSLEDADVPEVSDKAALTQLTAAMPVSGESVNAIIADEQASAPIASQPDGSSSPPTDLREGEIIADNLVGDPADDGIEHEDAADNLVEQVLSDSEASSAESGTPPKSPEPAAEFVPVAAEPSRAAPTMEASSQVPPSPTGRPGESAPELTPRAAQSEHGLRPVAEPHQPPRPGTAHMPEQAQPQGVAAKQGGGGAELSAPTDAAGRKERQPPPDGAQADARQQATRPAPDAAGRDPLMRLMETARPQRIEQMLPKAGVEPVDTPDLVAQTPGTVESLALRQEMSLPSVKLTLTPQQSPAQAIAVQIAHAAQGGVKRFEIRLDPPDLGRIEVRLEVTQDGRSSAHLLVERAETLDLLQRDARALERALQNAGLDTSEGGLKFSLKDQGLARHSAQQADIADTAGNTDDSNHEDEDRVVLGPGRWLNAAEGGLDIRV